MPNLFDNATLLCVKTGCPGADAKMSQDEYDVKAGTLKNRTKAKKIKIKSATYDAIKTAFREMRQELSQIALPGHMFTAGSYLIPDTRIDRAEQIVEKCQSKINHLVPQLQAEWDNILDNARTELGDLFDISEYPPVSELPRRIYVQTEYRSIDVPGKLQRMRQDIFTREKEKLQRDVADAGEEIKVLLRTEFQQLVTHMVERLQPDTDGKPKIFKASVLDNLANFMENFGARNILDDQELKTLVEQSRQLLQGASPEAIRGGTHFRDSLAAKMSDLKSQLDTMVTSRVQRKIAFEAPEAKTESAA